MENVRNRRHPRITVEQGGEIVYRKRPLCATKTGKYSCFKESRQSDLSKYGPGVVAYFQFLKFFATLFIVMAVLSAPCMAFYFAGTGTHGATLREVLVSFSIGNMGFQGTTCNTGTYSSMANTNGLSNYEASISLQCSYGTMTAIKQFGQISVGTKVDCKSVTSGKAPTYYPSTCVSDQWSAQEMSSIKAVFDADCVGKQACTFKFYSSQLPSQQCSVASLNNTSWQYLMYSDCKSDEITIGGASYTKGNLAIGIVVLDLVIGFLFWFAILTVRPLEKLVTDEINNGIMSAEDFTVIVKQMPYKDPLLSLPGIYYAWAENILEKSGYRYDDPTTKQEDIYQDLVLNVDLGLSSYGYFSFVTQITALLDKIKIAKARLKVTTNENKIFKLKKEIKSLKKQAVKKYEQTCKWKNEHKAESVYAYIQFQSQNGKKKFLKEMQKSWFYKFVQNKVLCRRVQNQHKYLGGVWPWVRSAPDPSLINWKNLGVSACSRFVRQVIILLLCLVFIIAGFAGIVYAINYNIDQSKSSWSESSCGTQAISNDEAYQDYMITPATSQQGLLPCYCFEQFKSIGMRVSLIGFGPQKSEQLCSDWLTSYTQAKVILYAVSFAISLINIFLKNFIAFVSRFEAHHDVTEAVMSTTTKMWVIQFLSTAVVLLLVNANWTQVVSLPQDFPILNGPYNDFVADWYVTIGATICLTCFFNTIMPLTNLVWWGVAKCKRCRDRQFRLDAHRTIQLVQSKYEDIYTGPQMQLETRYSQIIATCFIILMYSTTMPFLYLSGALIFTCMYWTDKILFLKYYRTPPMYTTKLAGRTYTILELAVVIHFVFGFYMIAQPQIFSYSSDDIATGVAWARPFCTAIGELFNQWFGISQNRFYQTHVVVYGFGIFIFLILFVLEKLLGIPSFVIRNIIKLTQKGITITQDFSSNLLAELSFDDLQMEYSQTLHHVAKAMHNKSDPSLNNSQSLYQYYLMQLQFKLRRIKIQLAQHIKSNDQTLQKKSTIKQFEDLRQIQKQGRITNLYSYNILDNPEFIRNKKIELRIEKMQEKAQIRERRVGAGLNKRLAANQHK